VHHHRFIILGLWQAVTLACSSTSDPATAETPALRAGAGGASAGSSAALPPAPTPVGTAGSGAGSGAAGSGSPGGSGEVGPPVGGVSAEPEAPPSGGLLLPDAGTPGAGDPAGEGPPVTEEPPVDEGGVFGLGGPSRCANSPLAICESFEGAALGAAPPAGWTTGGYGNRTFSIVDDDRARGAHALRIDVAGNQGAVVGMLVRTNLGALGARHFGRSFVKIAAPAPTGFVHFDVFEARGDYEGQVNMVRWASTGTNVGTTASNWSWIYNVQSSDHGEFGSEGNRSAHPRDGDWMCLEWSIEAAAQEARFWQDGTEVEYLHIDTERSEIPVFDSFNVGFQKFQQTAGAWRVWVDEVAFDGERIGCDG
jgi:hypothetical protein